MNVHVSTALPKEQQMNEQVSMALPIEQHMNVHNEHGAPNRAADK